MYRAAVGDKVEIIDAGYVYSTYKDWAESNLLFNWKIDVSPDIGTLGTVVAVAEHGDDGEYQILCGVEINSECSIIIEEKGLKCEGGSLYIDKVDLIRAIKDFSENESDENKRILFGLVEGEEG